MPVDGAEWVSGLTEEFGEIFTEAKTAEGWYVESLPMLTTDGTNVVRPSLMWDASRAYCTGFINCEDLEGADRMCLAFLTESQ